MEVPPACNGFVLWSAQWVAWAPPPHPPSRSVVLPTAPHNRRRRTMPKNHGMSMQELSRHLGQVWNSMPPDEKAPFLLRAHLTKLRSGAAATRPARRSRRRLPARRRRASPPPLHRAVTAEDVMPLPELGPELGISLQDAAAVAAELASSPAPQLDAEEFALLEALGSEVGLGVPELEEQLPPATPRMCDELQELSARLGSPMLLEVEK